MAHIDTCGCCECDQRRRLGHPPLPPMPTTEQELDGLHAYESLETDDHKTWTSERTPTKTIRPKHTT